MSTTRHDEHSLIQESRGTGRTGTSLEHREEITWATAAHLSALSGWLLAGLFVVGPLLAWLRFRNRGAFVHDQVTEALNASLSWTLYTYGGFAVALAISYLTAGFGAGTVALAALVPLAASVLAVIGGRDANHGRRYRYPAIIRLVP